MRDRSLTPRPGLPREFDDHAIVDPERVARLEARMENGEGDIAEVKALLQKQRESHEGLRKTVDATSTELKVALKGLTTETKFVKWLLAVLVALGFLSGVMRFFGH